MSYKIVCKIANDTLASARRESVGLEPLVASRPF